MQLACTGVGLVMPRELQARTNHGTTPSSEKVRGGYGVVWGDGVVVVVELVCDEVSVASSS